jgi:hypothetical protein
LGVDVYASEEGFASCSGKGTLYLTAKPGTAAVAGQTAYQLMSYDMNTGSKAVTLTSIEPSSGSSYSYLYDLTPSPDCSHVAFRAGHSSKFDVYSVKPGSPTVVARLTDSASSKGYHYVYDTMQYSTDSKQLVYLHGTSSSDYQMYANWSTAGPCCKEALVYNGGSSSYKYWILFGVK